MKYIYVHVNSVSYTQKNKCILIFFLKIYKFFIWKRLSTTSKMRAFLYQSKQDTIAQTYNITLKKYLIFKCTIIDSPKKLLWYNICKLYIWWVGGIKYKKWLDGSKQIVLIKATMITYVCYYSGLCLNKKCSGKAWK